MPFDHTQARQLLEDALECVLPQNPSPDWILRVAGPAIGPVSPADVAVINAPAYDILHRGGKRWRPWVMYLTWRMLGGGDDFPWELGSLVELPHNGSLIVDDIEDHSAERRGKPAAHLVYGVDQAINSGNFLYFLPTYLLEQLLLSTEIKYRVVQIYLQIMRRLHFGQGIDIQWHNDHGFIPSIEDYFQMCRFKTGSLSCMAAQLGAALATESETVIQKSGAVWEEIGVGFQIMDDVKDLITGNPGKMRGDDIIEGKKSLPVILHCKTAPDGGDSLLALFQRVREERDMGSDMQPLVEDAIALMSSSGALAQASEQGQKMLKDALGCLNDLCPDSEFRQAAHTMVWSFLPSLATTRGRYEYFA